MAQGLGQGTRENHDRSGHEGQPELREQVAQLTAQLAQTQKMAAMGELLSTTTHEFNNILTTIMNYAKIGLRHRDEATQQKAFTKILDASNRAAKITSTVLGVARNRSDTLQATDLEQLIEDSLVLLEREMNKYRIALDRDFKPVPAAWANGNQIQQVLLNLLINARQAMPKGGRILLRLGHDVRARMVVLVVRDFGSGIPPEKLQRIFDPFFSTKAGPDESGKGGTGLGLSACKNIIEAHRGRIRVESTPGKGTAFTIRLPVAPQPATPVPAVAGDTSPVPADSHG